uniref:C-jun-amino-terminal kinase-interacting protein 3 n=1 Tax=Hemiscolopendra marginata TaxID=943146 RepID=A0A646QFG0_9MYRI
MEMEIDQETVYGTHEDSHVMSEKVQSLAGSIYQEFERMIQKYDEDVVKDLMPLIVNVLEHLDLAYTETQEHEVDLELLREDNEQLLTQYEREKQLRKSSEQKCIEVEDAIEGENKELQEKIESLESIVRMLELKAKNSSDHVSRLEEKENEMKKEYNKLHERYTELFKTHMDYMERTKILFGTDKLDQLSSSRQRPSLQLSQLRSGVSNSYSANSAESPVKPFGSPLDFSSMTSPNRSSDSNTSLKSELQEMTTTTDVENTLNKNIEVQSHETLEKGQITDAISLNEKSTITRGGWVDNLSPEIMDIVNSTPELEDIEDISQDLSIGPENRQPTKTQSNLRHNNLYQELSFQDTDALGDVDEGADITGMGKEVENLIMENNELLATNEQEMMHQEICSLEAVKEKLKARVTELEEEMKKMKEEMQKNAKGNKSDDEEDVPMAQRKRFTRVEMARVLMERNQYKERFMELQEAVRWTEMIRASRTDPTIDAKKSRTNIWKFFSNLFSAGEKPQRKPLPYVNVRYNAPTHHVSPALDTMRRKTLNDRRRGLDFLDSELASEKLQAQKAKERREQYKQVRAHVKKDDGRMQAYGWSLPAKATNAVNKNTPVDINSSKASNVPVPVPVYCRPLLEKQPGMKKEDNSADIIKQDGKEFEHSEIWCAAGVNMTGGRTRDGGSIVGASIFYSNSTDETLKPLPADQSEVDKLDQELQEQEKDRIEEEEMEKNLSSLVWICTSTHNNSWVTVIDANNPADVLESFLVCTSHLLCIASVPGAKENDYPIDEGVSRLLETDQKIDDSNQEAVKDDIVDNSGAGDACKIGSVVFIAGHVARAASPNFVSSEAEKLQSNLEDNDPVTNHSNDVVSEQRLLKMPSDMIKDGVSEINKCNEIAYEEMEKMSSVLPTMWLGSQSGNLYVHSAVAQWKRCLHSIKLGDSVLSIVHVKGRVLVALADGTVAIFRRGTDGQWDLSNYHLLDLGKPHHSIRCMVVVQNQVWCGYRNRIHVVEPKTMKIIKSFDAHPRKESQVRQMAWVGDGVWVSIRLDSTLRLYHAHTYHHLQDVDIEPYVSKMLGTGKLGFSFVRITALLISSNRLWMGTGNGVIISVPLSDNSKQSALTTVGVGGGKTPGGVVRVYSNPNDKVTPGSFIPYCSMAQAQLSFHGHRDAVKFFVAVPGSGGMSAASTTNLTPNESKEVIVTEENEVQVIKKPKCMLVISGGEGYIDFRIGDGEEEDGDMGSNRELDLKHTNPLSKGERSHLIVWQVTAT